MKLRALALMFLGNFAHGAEIVVVPAAAQLRHMSDQRHILIKGEITPSDPERLALAVREIRNGAVEEYTPLVVLDSVGGNVLSALEMGRILRISLAHTLVAPGGECSSSCVFVFSGGVIRSLLGEGVIGLHRPRFQYEAVAQLSAEEARSEYTVLTDTCRDFMKEMGISPQVFEDMLGTPSQELVPVNREYAVKNSLVGRDPGWEEWSRARDVMKVGEDGMLREDALTRCLEEGRKDSACEE